MGRTVKTVAIFGAGPATGLSLARRFGREGYRVALVARRQESLDELVAALPDIETVTVVADLVDHDQLAGAVAAIERRFGHIDAAVYSPGGLDQERVAVLDVDPVTLPGQLGRSLLAPIALARLLLPGMRERGAGALLFASGTSATEPTPQLANIGVALAGLRSYVRSVNAVVAEDGVYVGVVHIGGLIRHSAVERLLATETGAAAFPGFDVAALRQLTIEPDAVADVFWDLQVTRDRAEETIGA